MSCSFKTISCTCQILQQCNVFICRVIPYDLINHMVYYQKGVTTKGYDILKSYLPHVNLALGELDMSDLDISRIRLDEYLMQLLVIWFNFGKYNINVIKPYLALYFFKAACVYVDEVMEIEADLGEEV